MPTLMTKRLHADYADEFSAVTRWSTALHLFSGRDRGERDIDALSSSRFDYQIFMPFHAISFSLCRRQRHARHFHRH